MLLEARWVYFVFLFIVLRLVLGIIRPLDVVRSIETLCQDSRSCSAKGPTFEKYSANVGPKFRGVGLPVPPAVVPYPSFLKLQAVLHTCLSGEAQTPEPEVWVLPHSVTVGYPV